jgi:RimJ/RimL family protein N-acetyltransferase
MTLQTDRLELIPLTARQLRLWLDDLRALEAELSCAYRGEPLDDFFGKIVRKQIEKTEQHPERWLYHTVWLILRKSDRVVVGSCDLKGPPDANSEVEVGYGLGEECQGSGYMTEAIRALCGWALGQDEVAHVIAETEPGNVKSENVLRRVGFALYQQGETNWWRL